MPGSSEINASARALFDATMKTNEVSRRMFLRPSVSLAAGAPILLRDAQARLFTSDDSPAQTKTVASAHRSDAKVAIVSCRSYGPEVRTALDKSFDLIGGISGLVKNKTV